jgi:hypothetical protein
MKNRSFVVPRQWNSSRSDHENSGQYGGHTCPECGAIVFSESDAALSSALVVHSGTHARQSESPAAECATFAAEFAGPTGEYAG